MEQTVVAAGGPLRQVALLEDNDVEASQAGVPSHAEACGAATDDKELCRSLSH
jgi:hypothetical protein